MDTVLNDIELRVLGSLVEKEITTPEYYPMTLNALVAACNQKSNRDPVVNYDEPTVADALDSLREKGLVLIERLKDSRVPKYDNYFKDGYKLTAREVAIMDVLMLRGPQTVGELRIRGERMYQFTSLEEVEEALDALAERELVVKLPRQVGQKESRYVHLLGGEPDTGAMEASPDGVSGRIEILEARVIQLQQEQEDLKRQLAELRGLFE